MRFVRTVLEADLARLKEAREAADRLYNDALTALDSAVIASPPVPSGPSIGSADRPSSLRSATDLATALPEPGRGLSGWLGRHVLRLVGPAFGRQQAFNEGVADCLADYQTHAHALTASVGELCRHAAQLGQVETQLLTFLQQITPYVDTKDYEVRGLATRITEDVADGHARLAAAVEVLVARLDAAVNRLERVEGMGEALGPLHLAVQALRREVAGRTPTASGASAPASPVYAGPAVTSGVALSSDPLTSHKYVAFENLFRGDRDAVRARQTAYLPLFVGRRDVLDLGCGRGELLQLLAQHGVGAYGLDANHEMAAAGRAEGLDVREGDALAHLRSLSDDTLGGLAALQVVEHLAPDYLIALLDEAFRVLRPGSPIVVETINVGSWYAFFNSYVRDITHERPLHPDTLKFLITAAGFLDARVELRVPLPPSEQLGLAPAETRALERDTAGAQAFALLALADAFDRNMARLNAHLYAPLDYVVVARKAE